MDEIHIKAEICHYADGHATVQFWYSDGNLVWWREHPDDWSLTDTAYIRPGWRFQKRLDRVVAEKKAFATQNWLRRLKVGCEIV